MVLPSHYEDMLNLIVGSTVISYSIRRSPRAKHVSISVGADGVQIVAPVTLDEREIIELVEKKREWILNKFEIYCKQGLVQIKSEREFVSDEMLLFMGKDYPLMVIECEGRYTSAIFKDDQFLIYINKDIPREERRESIKRKLEQWYISEAKKIIHERIERYTDKIGPVKVNSVRFKNQKTRWGSCSQKGNLNFNWRLIMAPIYIVDYVVVHELCHLSLMNHSKEFWQLVGNQIPDYKERRKWLKENGLKLRM